MKKTRNPTKNEAEILYALCQKSGRWILDPRFHHVCGIAAHIRMSVEYTRKRLTMIESKGWVRRWSPPGSNTVMYSLTVSDSILKHVAKVMQIKPEPKIVTCPRCGASYSTVWDSCPGCRQTQEEKIMSSAKKQDTSIVQASSGLVLPGKIQGTYGVNTYNGARAKTQIAPIEPASADRNALSRQINAKKQREARRFSDWAKDNLSPEKHRFLPVVVDGSGFLVSEEFWEERSKVLAEKQLLPVQKVVAKNGIMISYAAAELLEGANHIVQEYYGDMR